VSHNAAKELQFCNYFINIVNYAQQAKLLGNNSIEAVT